MKRGAEEQEGRSRRELEQKSTTCVSCVVVILQKGTLTNFIQRLNQPTPSDEVVEFK